VKHTARVLIFDKSMLISIQYAYLSLRHKHEGLGEIFLVELFSFFAKESLEWGERRIAQAQRCTAIAILQLTQFKTGGLTGYFLVE